VACSFFISLYGEDRNRRGYEDMSEFFEEIAKDEAEHAGELATGSGARRPALANFSISRRTPTRPYPKPPKATDDYKAMIRSSWKRRRARSTSMQDRREDDGQDHVTYQLACHIMAEEVAHEENFEDLFIIRENMCGHKTQVTATCKAHEVTRSQLHAKLMRHKGRSYMQTHCGYKSHG